MKTILRILLLLTVVTVCVAQEQPKKQDVSSAPATQPLPKKTTAYKLDFKVYELAEGKRVNEREYSLNTTALERDSPYSSLRIGVRVPVPAGEKQNYMDVGMNIMCRLTDEAGKLLANVRLEMTSFMDAYPESHSPTMPMLRNTNLYLDSILDPGRPRTIGSVDDLNSKKRIQVEVTATRLD
jgi:hypothetical protein